ncbi:MAG: hypothetical protein A2X23_03275 [Chloroflexi bacterium GWC2_73_18]|nr:MAG: hypothetical protein A2X23_03275 [Chloroflexi bacterium GWC2_73_18]
MVARAWRGATAAADADAYVEYLEQTGVRDLRATPGNGDVRVLRRVRDDGLAEFWVISFWESRAAIEAFAGPVIERAVFYPEDDRYLVERDLTATHHEVSVGP